MINARPSARPASTGRALTVCVFAGARSGGSPAAVEAATEAGTELGLRGHHLLYGAGGAGIMGAVARAAAAAGAPITGVVPKFLYERERAQQAPAQRHVITDDMFDRKRYMLDASDAFLALPGGFGTVDEVLDVISLQTLGLLSKPCVLLDTEGIWSQLVGLLEELPRRGYADRVVGGPLWIASSPKEALDTLETAALLGDRTHEVIGA
ncbi:TIGR00730 family Rossman fold protein [Kitasatospora sp. LaBMicrA B282]|uniref:LOG family protein n=1 Tax=Kitasatospora sp. LaBMicrA B282 TaxID=3420949 RepID=UPI003D14F9F0